MAIHKNGWVEDDKSYKFCQGGSVFAIIHKPISAADWRKAKRDIEDHYELYKTGKLSTLPLR